MRKLPPLKALRAFEAAANRESFSAGADELNVTQAAVSHQIRALEEWFGFPLFRRDGRAVHLTDDGRQLFRATRTAFDTIAGETARLLDRGQIHTVTVTTLQSFAATWLVPHLRRFRRLHPDIDVRVTTREEVIDLTRSDIDLAIRYGLGEWPGLHVERLMGEDLFPVCSPELAAGPPGLRALEDLRHHTLIHDDYPVGWEAWLRTVGAPTDIDVSRGPLYDTTSLVVDAAVAGDGVALGRSALVEDALASGRLVRPLDITLPGTFAYYFVCNPDALERQAVRQFHDWLVDEIASVADAATV